jgi:hypothetical protein
VLKLNQYDAAPWVPPLRGHARLPVTRTGHHAGVNLLPAPDATLSDSAVDDALRGAVRIIEPLLDLLWGSDPLRLKRRTCGVNAGAGPVDRVADGIGWALNAVDVPGTDAWDDLDVDERIQWWVWRVGALNNVAVAFPGFLGILARQLPIQDLLGFVNQAIVLCAVARELGVTDQQTQVRLLAAVLCGRELSAAPHVDPAPPPPDISRTPAGIARALWRLAGLLDAVGDEVAKRPHPRAPFDYLGMLPGVGAIAGYFGELGALSRAAKKARRWIAENAGTGARV